MQIFKIIKYSCLVMLLLTAVNIPSLAIDNLTQITSMNTCLWSGNYAVVAAPYDPVDVENCISEASSKIGEVTIRIPAANLVWQERVTVDMSQGFELVSSLTLTGTGNPTGIGSSGQTIEHLKMLNTIGNPHTDLPSKG